MNYEKLQSILKEHCLWLNTRHSTLVDGCRADLRDADLSCADLIGANLSDANLIGANLRGADLIGANLRNADLRDANLIGANLRDADLSGADLRDANLIDANLRDSKNLPFIPFACPDSGSFIGYKKARGYIVKLEILADALRCSSTGRKCRCNKARVLTISNLDGTDANISSVSSDRDKTFIYTVGEVVEVPDFDTDRWNECAAGIHFFINRQEAAEY